MEAQDHSPITIETSINAPIEKVWELWTKPEHIKNWNAASDDWHTPASENDLRVGGKFNNRMEAKDGSFGFNFEGTYTQVKTYELIRYALQDSRKVNIRFTANNGSTDVEETFDPETTNSIDIQRNGWQSILNNFKKYVEAN